MKDETVPINEKCCATCIYWFSERELVKDAKGRLGYKIIQTNYNEYCFNKTSWYYNLKLKHNSRCQEYLSKYKIEQYINNLK